MRIGKKVLSVILAVLMVTSVLTVAFSVNAVELAPVELTKMERPTATFTSSGMTRVSAGPGSFFNGNVIVKATPSGVPENNSTYSQLSYNGEVPVATSVTFSTTYDITDLVCVCTSDLGDVVLSEPVKDGNKTTWVVESGNATAGSYLEFSAAYKYKDRDYSTKCYSYVDTIAQGGQRVFTVHSFTSYVNTTYYSIVNINTRILGKGVKYSLTNYDVDYGLFDTGTGQYASAQESGYNTANFQVASSGSAWNSSDSTYHTFQNNAQKSVSTVYIDTSTTSSFKDINLRMNTNNFGLEYNNSKDRVELPGIGALKGIVEGNESNFKTEAGVLEALGVDYNDWNNTIAYPRGYSMNTTYFKGDFSKLSDGDTFTFVFGFRTEYSDVFMNKDIVNKTYVPIVLKVAFVDKSSLRSTINTVLSSEPTSPTVSNIYKGANPQSWYYKSGYSNFKAALASACAVLTNETASQSEIDTAQQSLESMYSNLVLNTADYSRVNTLLEEADTILANKDYYTEESISLLEEAYDGVTYSYNLFYQAAVDTMADNIQLAIDNLQYAPADYTVVETAKRNSDTSAITDYIDLNSKAKFTYAGNTVDYYTETFLATVAENAKLVQDAVDAVKTGLDITKQETVNAFAKDIENAYAVFKLTGADYTAVNALKTYAMSSLKAANYSNFTVVRNAVNKIRTGYSIEKQVEVDTMAAEIVAAINGLVLKDATKTVLQTALALVPDKDVSLYTQESYVLWATLKAQGQQMFDDDTLTILDNAEITAKAKEITDAFNALTLRTADKTALKAAIDLVPDYDESFYTEESYSAWTTAKAAGEILYAKEITAEEEESVTQATNAITSAFGSLTLKPATKTSLKEAIDLTPAYDEANYTDESLGAWKDVLSEAQTMYDDTTLTILDNQTVADKAAALAEVFGKLQLKAATKTPLETALGLTPEYEESYYTTASYSAWSTLKDEAQTMFENDKLTILDNTDISNKAKALTDAFNALEIKSADYEAYNEAVKQFNEEAAKKTLSVVTYEAGATQTGTETVENYTAESIKLGTDYIAECDLTLKILDQDTVDGYVTEINTFKDSLVANMVTAYLDIAVNEYSTLTQSDYTPESWTTYSVAIANATGYTNQAMVNDALNAIVGAKNALVPIQPPTPETYTFNVKDGAVIDTERGFIYGLEEGADVRDYLDYEDCEVVVTETAEGCGTGTKVEVKFKDEVVETYYVVIFGDVTGDGYIDAFDVSILASVANYETEFEDGSALLFAGDLAEDEFIDTFDLSIISSAANSEIVISQRSVAE